MVKEAKATNKYLVKHNFIHKGQFVEAGQVLKENPAEVRYLVLGGQLEVVKSEENQANAASASSKSKNKR